MSTRRTHPSLQNKPANLRRIQSSTRTNLRNNPKFNLDLKNNLPNNDNEIKDLEKLVNDKIDNLSQTIKSERENDKINKIEDIISNRLNKIEDSFQKNLNEYKNTSTIRENNIKDRYLNLYKEYCILEKKYESVKILQENQFYRYMDIMNFYQNLLYKVSVSNISQEIMSKEEKQKVEQIMRNIDDDNSSVATSITDNEEEQMHITNPLVSHRHLPPIMKSTSNSSIKRKSFKEKVDGDELQQLLEN